MARKKTGERRETRQPLKIDRLPVAMQDRIRLERVAGRSWQDNEDLSPKFEEWKDVPDSVVRLFEKQKLPHSNLQRWYDLRIEQVQKEALEQAETARQFAASFTGLTIEKADDAVMNALRDQVFSMVRSNGDQKAFIKELNNLGRLLAQFKRIGVQRERVNIERDKLALVAAKIKGLKSATEKKQLSPAELQQKLDEIYGITEA